ncbi:MAG: gliding motility-associated C-terminal domain-containing protein [Crocinitomicaceae bacterium]|nr:gliding motility-associated C-terminal domain-containing protein [Crocinitomicaceae bacterium]
MSLRVKELLVIVGILLSSNFLFAGGNPTADFSITPSVAPTGTTVCFTDASTAEDPPLTDWLWTFDGQAPDATIQNPPCVTYNTPGTYDVCLTVTESDGDDNQDCQTVTIYNEYNVGTENGNTITTCSGMVTDPGGFSGNYGNNQNNTVTFCSGSTDLIQFQMQMIALGAGDQINIYEGTGTGGNQIAHYTSTNNGQTPSLVALNTCITVEFISDGTGVDAGFQGIVSCVPDNYYLISGYDGQTITDCGGSATFWDPGGPGGNYGNNQNYTITFCADDPSEVVQILFQSMHLSAGDVLNVYDGVGTSGQLVYTIDNTDNGNNSFLFPGLTVTGISQCVTYEFISNGSGTNSGWEGDISCETPPPYCNPGNNPPAADNFEAATPICDFTQYCGTTSSFYGVDMGPWGQTSWFDGSLENNSWLMFTADATTATFNVSTDAGCSGIQIGIYSVDAAGNVTWHSPPAINGGFDYTNIDNGFSGSGVLNANNLTPGETYYIMIDGHGGAVCDYWLTAGIGVAVPDPQITGNATMCFGDAESLTVTDLNGSTNINWIWTWNSGAGGPVSGSSIDLSTFPPGTYTFDVIADGFENCADPSDVSDQFTITINPCGCTPPTININNLSVCSPNSVDLNSAIDASSDPATISFHASATDANNDINPISSTVSVSGTYHVRAEDPGDPTCFTVETITVTVNNPPNINATGDATICQGDPAVTISASGDAGTFSWDNGLGTGASHGVSPATTTTYTVTLTDGNGCTNTDQVTITVNTCACTPPVFTVTNPAAICSPATYDLTGAVSGTGANIVSYHASNADANADINALGSTVVSASGTYYVRVEDPGDPTCFSVQPITVTVNTPVTPTFDGVSPICSGDALAALPTTSTNGITGTWSPALDNTATTTYTFTPTAGQCATTTTLTITVNPNVTPTFNPVAAICSGDALAALPTTSTNGITGTWSPALDNTATTTYTFTPTAGQCATTTTLTITVNPNVTPTFNPVAAICSGDALAALPTTSTNGITGTWSPALDNTATTTYTFTPTAGQCATTTTLTITVNPLPTFTVTPSNPTSCLLSNGTITISGLDPNTVYIIDDGSGPLVNPSDAFGEIVLSGYGPTTINSISIEDQNTGCTTVDNTGWTLTAPAAPTITVNPDQTICAGESVTLSSTVSSGTVSWVDNFAITHNEGDVVSPLVTTTYTATASDNGCNTSASFTITVTPEVTPTFNPVAAICSGDALAALPTTSTNGITGTWSPALDNTATTTYTFTPTAGQCATTTTLTITVNSPTTNTVNVDVCENDSYTFADGSTSTITASTSLVTTLTAANGCDSVVTENITMLSPVANTVNADVCDGDSYTFADGSTSTITASTSLVTTLTAANGCDSVVTENITMIPVVTNTVTVNLCSGANHTYADGTVSNNITANESHVSILTSAAGCDSTVTENVVIGPNITNTVNVDVCENNSYTFADGSTSTITASTSLVTTLVSLNGCDSVVTENITMLPIITNTINVDVCDGGSYTFADGSTSTITASTSLTTILTAASGCDSVVTENVNMLSPVANTVNVDVCENDSYTFADGSTSTITASTSLVTTLTGANGCDSVVTENITMLPVYNITENVNACENSTYTFPDASTQVITANTSYTSNLTSAGGCDSIIVTNVTMDPIQNTTVNTDICSGSSFTYADGTTSTNITANESHVSTLTSAAGCDSIVTENLNIVPAITNTIDVDVCENNSYTFADGSTSTITASTSLVTTLVSANGCDSIITENITMLPVFTNTLSVNLCSGANHTYADGTVSNNITANESHVSILTSAGGCDSTVTENVIVGPNITNTINIDVCENESYTFADGSTSSITASTSLVTTLVSANGCDSVITENITMLPIYNITENVNACENSTYTFPDASTQVITANTSYTSNLTSAGGCDSIIVTNVTMDPIQNTTNDIVVCENSTVTYPDGTTEVITSNTTQTSVLTSAAGCDSTIVTTVTMNPVYNIAENITVCEGETVTYPDGTSETISSSTVHTSSLLTASGCDSIIVTTVNMNALPVIAISFTDPTTCGATDGTITLSGLNAGSSYSVSYNGNANSSMTANGAGEIIFTNLATGSYTDFYVEDANGCSILDNTIINIAPLSAPSIDNILKDDLSCQGDASGQIQITASGGNGALTYEIDNGAGFNASNGTGVFTGLDAGTYSITVTDAVGCQTTDILVVNEPGNVLQNVASTDILCFGDADGTIQWISVSGGTPPYTYSIDNGANYSPSGNFGGLSGGAYSVTVQDLNGCNSDTAEVVIFEPNELLLSASDVPVTQPTCVSGNPTCNGAIEINVPAGGGVAPYTYIWPNGIAQSTSNMAVDLCGGQYNIAVEDANGCLTNLQVNMVDPVPPAFDDLTTVDAGCNNDCNGLIDITSSTTISFTVNGNTQATGYFDNLCAGTYDIIITDTAGCSNSQQVDLISSPSPLAQFIFDPGYGTIDDSEITFTNLSENADSYYWTIYGNDAPNDNYFWGTSEEEFTHTFPTEPGTYQVCMKALSNAGCADTMCTVIEIRDDFTIFVPNAFTPDGDGTNQVFKPYLNGIDVLNYELLIFNRWGELLFESHNKEVGWDGTYMGKIVQDGVYVWKINVKLQYTDEKKSFYGHVTVIK